MTISAAILKNDLIEIINRAENAIFELYEKSKEDDSETIRVFMENHKKGFLFWKKPYENEEEARDSMILNYDYYFYNTSRISRTLDRLREIKERLHSDKLYDITLSEDEMSLLKDYYNE